MSLNRKSTKVFISQPMGGFDQEHVVRVRQAILDQCPKLLGVSRVIEIPMMSVWQAESHSAAYNLGYSIENLSAADVAIFAPGWEDARGCKIEHLVCTEYGIPHVELQCDPATGRYRVSEETYTCQKADIQQP